MSLNIKLQVTVVSGDRSLKFHLRQGVYIFFSDRLVDVLGIDRKELNPDGSIGHADHKAVYRGHIDTSVGYHTCWIYSNFVEHGLVGSQRVPLLRMFSVSSPNSYIHQVFERPYYVPVCGSYFPMLEVFIRDISGTTVPFAPGEAVLNVHFRRRMTGRLLGKA